MVLRNKADVSAGMKTQQRGVLACKHTVVTQTLTPPQYFLSMAIHYAACVLPGTAPSSYTLTKQTILCRTAFAARPSLYDHGRSTSTHPLDARQADIK